MNERIDKLFEQALEEFKAENKYATIIVPDPLKEKFAELIVRECMRQVEEQYKPVLEDEVMMKDTHWDGYVQGGVDCYVAISSHFYGEEE
jgi:hypothetical protein